MKTSQFRRMLASILTLVVLMGALPLGTLAAPAVKSQVVNAGGETSYESGKVKVSKTIAQSSTEENQFDITLKVVTTQEVKQIPADAAVVLVLDMSTSMVNTKDSKGVTQEQNAKAAAKAFINSYVDGSTDFTGVQRLLSIVQFGTQAQTVAYTSGSLYGWGDAANAGVKQEALSAITNQVKNGFALSSGGSAGAYTNMSAGLRIAYNLIGSLKNSDSTKNIKNLYVVLLSDGLPTARLYGGKKTYAEQRFNDSSDTMDSAELKLLSGTYSTNSDQAKYHKAAATYQANTITGAGTKLYSIAYNTSEGETFLRGISSSVYSAGSAAQLNEAFANINKAIRLNIDAWKVSDPMGEYIRFDSVESGTRGEAVVKYNKADRTLNWDIQSDDTVKVEGTNPKTYTYTLKYKVELDTLKDGYIAGKEYAANGITTLKYYLGTIEELKELKTVNFQIPSVKGFAGSLNVKKLSAHDSQALPGAQFSVKFGDKVYAQDISNALGQLTLSGIPSGHTFDLVESAAPDGYLNLTGYKVRVSFGEASLIDPNGDPVSKSGSQYELKDPLDPKPVNITVEKRWVGPALSEVFVTLHQKLAGREADVSMGQQRLHAGNGWSYEYKDLPTVDSATGKTFTYYATEQKVDGYKTDIGSVAERDGVRTITVTNTVSGSHDIAVVKNWIAPAGMIAPVTIKLLANGAEVRRTTLNGNGDSFVFKDVDTFDSYGNKITYSVEEITMDDAGHPLFPGVSAPTYKNNEDRTRFTVTNAVAQELISVNGVKVWIDGGKSHAGESITVVLLRDGQEYTSDTAAAPGFTFSFPELPRYDLETGREHVYTVSDAVAGYTCEAGTAGNNYKVTNTIEQELLDFSVNKSWKDGDNEQGLRPASVTFELWRTADFGVAGKSALESVALTAETVTTVIPADPDVEGSEDETVTTTTWPSSVSFTGRYDRYDLETGMEIDYKVVEVLPDGSPYASNVSLSGSTAEAVNALNAVDTEISVQKIWIAPDATLPAGLTVDLLANGTVVQSHTFDTAEELLKGAQGFKHAFTAPVTDDDGKLIAYTVAERSTDSEDNDLLAPFTGVTTGNAKDGYVITNTIKQVADVSVHFEKVWTGAPNATRPTITVRLLRDGHAVEGKAVVIKAGDPLTGSFENLDRYNLATGGEYVYTVSEDDVAGYDKRITVKADEPGTFLITNSFKQQSYSATIVKTWASDGETALPAEIKVQLWRSYLGTDGMTQEETVGDLRTVTPDGQGNWQLTVDGLDSFNAGDAGQPYTYFVKELEVEGFVTAIDKSNPLSITNVSTRKAVGIEITKAWVGPEVGDSVEVQLLRKAGDEPAAEVGVYTVYAKDGWKLRIDDLDKYDASFRPYTYSIKEVTVLDGYDSSVSGMIVTNTVRQQKTEVAGVKSWEGAYEQLPAEIKVQLLANGAEVKGAIATVTAEGEWKYSFTELPMYALPGNGVVFNGEDEVTNGAPIVYTVKEIGEINGRIKFPGKEQGSWQHFTVSYTGNEGPFDIKNTFDSLEFYKYKVIYRYYELLADGTRPAEPTGEIVDGFHSGAKDQDVKILADEHASLNDKAYSYVGGHRSNDAESLEPLPAIALPASQNTIGFALERSGFEYVVVLEYERQGNYSYRIDRNYSVVTDGGSPVLESHQSGSVVSGNRDDVIAIDPSLYTSHGEHTYAFIDGDLDGDALPESFILLEDGHTYVITLNYERTATTPPPAGKEEYRKVTVEYREEITETVLHDSSSFTQLLGSAYSAESLTVLAIDGYTRTRVVGVVSGTLNSDVLIVVYYEKNAAPEIPVVTTPTSEIADFNPPLADLPPVVPSNDIIILETDIPLGELPNTGYTRKSNAGLLAGLSFGLAALALALGLRKEEDAEEA